MTQLVFEFVARDLDAVLMAAERFVGASPKNCEIAYTYLSYEPCATFEDAISKIRAREAISAMFRPEGLNVRYVLINEPQFDGATMPGWFGTIEYTDTDYSRIWNELLRMPLQLACLGFEEGVELDQMENLVSDEFPWNAPELVVGAVRDSSGEWDVRRGVNYFAPR